MRLPRRQCGGGGRGPAVSGIWWCRAGKAALAASVAWAVASWWLKAPMAFVAPWVAIVLVESRVYRSIAHGLQQLAAIAVGTVVATGVALTLDSTMVAMVQVLPAAVLLGQWQRLGSQGIYAATGALFVLTSGRVTIAASAARIAEAVFGAVVGIAVNALIRPPVYLRDTRAALEDAAREAQEILDAVADGLACGDWDGHAAGDRHERAASGTPGRPGPLSDRLEPGKHARQSAWTPHERRLPARQGLRRCPRRTGPRRLAHRGRDPGGAGGRRAWRGCPARPTAHRTLRGLPAPNRARHRSLQSDPVRLKRS
ncbi:aromatic acid exporter family protein [Streptomyces sp. NPDC048251]|uniref:FUSC family protein n=1 Tax=Streptomyces sp. NPDC048251 TaxID=3154501 RepID=UPI00344083E0